MVIPEIEMPGHTSEVFAAYPDLSCKGEFIPVNPGSYWPNIDIFCAGNEDVFKFLQDVLEEVIDLFPGPYVHIGGDEAHKEIWESCPKCQKRIVDEGLADVLGYLVSGRSDFLGDSLDNVDRSLEGDHQAEKVPFLPGEEPDDSFLSTYDPYPLGSVYAATIWSIDQQIQSPLRILNWVLESTETFGIRVRDGSIPNSVDMGYQWLNIFVELAIDDNERQKVCESIETHFTSIHVVPEC